MSSLDRQQIEAFHLKHKLSIYQAAMLWIEEEPIDDYDYDKQVQSVKPTAYYEICREILLAIKNGDINPIAIEPKEILKPGYQIDREDIYGRTLRPIDYDETDFAKYLGIVPTKPPKEIITEEIEFGMRAGKKRKWDILREADLDVYCSLIERNELARWAFSKGEKPHFLIKDIEELEKPSDKPIMEKEQFQHEDDFSWVIFLGKKIMLTSYQAEAVRLLYEAYKKEAPGLNQHKIITEIDSKSQRLRDVFKSRIKEVWGEGKLIVRCEGMKGFFRLNL